MQSDKVIHCRCDPKSECMINSTVDNSCVTNEGCFKSIHINSVTGKRDLTMGCFKNKSQHYLMHCKVKALTQFEIKCCRDRNFCNDYLSLPSDKLLNTSYTIGMPHANHYTSVVGIRLVFAIVVPICLLIIMAGLLTVCWKSLWQQKRKSTLKILHNAKNFHDSSLIKKPLFAVTSNIGWQIETLICNGLPGSKNSSGIGAKSNGTATTLLSASDTDHMKLNEDTCTSGSGSGLPMLVQRTVSRQITLLECIGKGKFGEVWKGQFQGEFVAVKIFSSREESSWARETTIYNTVLLRHDNILGYYASDLISSSGCTQLWMVMQYHPMGSLNEYLEHNPLTTYSALKLAHSAAAGLCHLHTSIVGLQGKPAIAHRDVKSKNILVKNNGTCCIADLGLAVFSVSLGSIDIVPENSNRIVGTKRYMAPELLEVACSLTDTGVISGQTYYSVMEVNGFKTLDIQDESCMESLKAIDVYAFSLVLWEIFSCVILDGIVRPYQLPFGEMVASDPSFEDMYHIVVNRKLRPIISDSLKRHFNPVARIIEECWHQRSSIRLTMLRVKKSLFMLMKQMYSMNNQSLPCHLPSCVAISNQSSSDFPFPLPNLSLSHSNAVGPWTSNVQ